jgi:hypothetical protein
MCQRVDNYIILPSFISSDKVGNKNDKHAIEKIREYESEQINSCPFLEVTKQFTKYDYVKDFWTALIFFVYDNIVIDYVINERTGIKYFNKYNKIEDKMDKHLRSCKKKSHDNCKDYKYKHVLSEDDIKYVMKWCHGTTLYNPAGINISYTYLYGNEFKKIIKLIKDNSYQMKDIMFKVNSGFTLTKIMDYDITEELSDVSEPRGNKINNHTDLSSGYYQTYNLESEFSLLELAIACYKINVKKFIFSYESYSHVKNITYNKKYEIKVVYE